MNSRERIRICNKEDRKGSLNANQVLRRLSVLCEGRQYTEAAHLVNRLSSSGLHLVATEMPLDLLSEALPYSAPLLENLFSRLNANSNVLQSSSSTSDISVDRIIWHLVKLFGSPCEFNLIRKCEKLVGLIGQWKPSLKQLLKEKEISLDNTVQGLGFHGLTSDFTSLHTALRRELQFHIETYKVAISVIDETESTQNSDPAQASHQRLLALKYDDIQKRLIDNKTLLTKLESPALKQLADLIENLRTRVEKDKNVLLCVNQIKKTDHDVDLKEWPAAKIILEFSRGCKSVLSLMQENSKSSSNSVEPTGLPEPDECGSDGYHSETEMDERRILIEEYQTLFKVSRAETLKALTVEIADSVKLKILFSIVVLAFRSCHSLRERKILEVRRTLNAFDSSGKNNEILNQLENSIKSFLLSTCQVFPLTEVENFVTNQIYSTLHDYSCINQLLTSLNIYIQKTTRLAWKLCNQPIPFHLDMDFTLSTINQKKHIKSSLSNQKSNIIQCFLWPALIQNTDCVSKAIVIT